MVQNYVATVQWPCGARQIKRGGDGKKEDQECERRAERSESMGGPKRDGPRMRREMKEGCAVLREERGVKERPAVNDPRRWVEGTAQRKS